MTAQPSTPIQQGTTSPSRRRVASYPNYAEAQRAVDYLSDQKFPVERVAIVGEGLRFVEQVTGRLNWFRSALGGAGAGALTGALIGFVFGLFDLVTPLISGLILAFYGFIFGAVIGAIFGLLSYAASGGRRDFTSTSGFQAERYTIMVDDDVAEEAVQVLVGMQ